MEPKVRLDLLRASIMLMEAMAGLAGVVELEALVAIQVRFGFRWEVLRRWFLIQRPVFHLHLLHLNGT